MFSLDKSIYKRWIATGQFLDTALWQFIFLYTQLHLARTITDENRALVGIFECALGFVSLTVLRQRWVINLATRKLVFIQLVDMMASIATRFLVVAFPATYMSTVAMRNALLSKLEFAAFQDLENKIFSGEERTDLSLIVQQANMAGALVGAGISWMIVGVSIQTICLLACFFCIFSYSYDIALGYGLKRIVAKELEKSARKLDKGSSLC
jgi:hypothetical protein